MWLFFFFSVLFLFVNIVWYSIYYGITPTPTSHKVKKKLLFLLPSTTGIILELGSGWGTLACTLAAASDGEVKAYEISPVPYFFSLWMKKWKKLKNLQIFRKDFFDISMQEASLIVCYLYPAAMKKLKIKFEKELTNGTYLVTHTFAIHEWIPIRIERVDDLYHTPIYIYQYPLSIPKVQNGSHSYSFV
jgi:hypothetical protein